MLLLSIIVNISLLLIVLTMYKGWGKKLSSTCLSAFLVYGCCFILKDGNSYQAWLKILVNIVFMIPSVFFIGVCIKIQNRLIIIQKPFLWLEILLFIICNIVMSFLFPGFEVSFFNAIIIGPVFETFICHEVIFNLLPLNKSTQKNIFLLLFVSLIIAILHWSFQWYYLLFRIVIFFMLYFIRYKVRSEKVIYLIMFLHFLTNFILCMIEMFL